LTLVISGSLLHLISLHTPSWGQFGESAAPWRIPAGEQPDLEISEPPDLNAATFEELLGIPGMTLFAANSILEYRRSSGSFSSAEQLREVQGIDGEMVAAIEPFVKVSDSLLADRMRLVLSWQQAEPYSEEVTRWPYRTGAKFTFQEPAGISLGMAAEKDPGEEQVWDHAAMCLKAPLPKGRGELFLGDYLVGFGNGLVINTARSFGLGRNPEANLRFGPQGLKPYSGWDENVALRGVGMSLHARPIHLSVWASRRWRDAYLDSLGNVLSFDLSGLHRASSEKSRENACQEDVLGVQGKYEVLPDRLYIAATGYSASWDRTLLTAESPTSHLQAGGIEVGAAGKTWQSNAEAAWDESGYAAAMGTVRFNLATLRAATALYRIAADYYSPLASSLDFDLGAVRNREGIYGAISTGWSWGYVSGFMHLYRYLQRSAGQSWGGQDISVDGSKEFGGLARFSLNSRWVQEDDAENQQKISRWRAAGAIAVDPIGGWELRSRLQLCRAHTVASSGRMLSLGMSRSLQIAQKLQMTAEFASGVYDAEDYDVRLYWSEVFLGGNWFVRSFWGKGSMVHLALKAAHLSLGKIEVILFWDLPEADSLRGKERCFAVTYKFP